MGGLFSRAVFLCLFPVCWSCSLDFKEKNDRAPGSTEILNAPKPPTPAPTPNPAPAPAPTPAPVPVVPPIAPPNVPPSAPTIPPGILPEDLSKELKIKITPSNKPERYTVQFSWPKLRENLYVRFRHSKTMQTVKFDQTDFNHEVDHNQVINYLIEILNEKFSVVKSFSKLVVIPFDFVVKETNSNINSDTKILAERTFLNSAFSLVTNGHNLEIITKEFHSENAVIETHKENKKSSFGIVARPGGNISIKSDLAVGKLKIALRGENGCDGINGAPITEPAQEGNSAGDGEEFCWCHRCTENSFNGMYIPLKSGQNPKSANGITIPFTPRQHPIKPLACECKSYGAPAGNGKPGRKGNPGGNACAGGNSGSFKLSVINGNEFDPQVIFVPGKKGTPGVGGEGQIGGAGGKSSLKKCAGPPGVFGPSGPSGESGLPASDGQKEEACIYIASTQRNECF